MSTTTIFQVGSYTSLTDAFTLVLDLNDRATFYLDTLDLAQPEKADTRVFNIRTPGEIVERVQYKNRKITATLLIRAATATALIAACRSLIAAIEHPPYVLRIQLPNGSLYSYADVVRVTHDIPFDAKAFLAGAVGAAGKKRVNILFECSPGLRGDRVVLSNAVSNPGFEAPSGPAVTVFNDTLANFNAYSVQAGAALAQDTLRFPDVVASLQGAAGASSTTLSILRYLRLDESSGTTAYDASPNVINGTTHASPTQGVASLLTGDTDTCYTFAQASNQYVSIPSTSMPTGNGAISMVGIFKFAANPTNNAAIWGYGVASTAHAGFNMYLSSAGKLSLNNGSAGTTIAEASASSTGTAHLAVATWDGTTMSLYVDNGAAVTATPGNQAIAASPGCNVGADGGASTGFMFNGQLDEMVFLSGCLTSAQVTSLYNAFHVAPAATANTMVIPSGGRVSFGSPAWTAINQWQVRYRYLSGGTYYFYLHYTDANNQLYAVVTGTVLTLTHVVAGVAHTLGTQTLALVNGIYYWLQVTQFPASPNSNAVIQAQNFVDNGGAVGSVSGGLLGPFQTFDAVTALSGAPQILASGTALGIGGNYSNVHTVGLFGPGGWTFTPSQNGVTGVCAGGWDGLSSLYGASGTLANTYPGGPATSQGTARLDLPPAGTVDCTWNQYTGGTPAGTAAMPVQTAGNVLGYTTHVKESGLNANATICLVITEYNAAGASLRTSGNLGALTGGALPTSWTQISGTYTTGANCAYVGLALRVVDTTAGGESAGATVWWDNCQVWDQTRTGMPTMPYCELAFAQSPAQLLVSGVVGDMKAPSFVSCGLYFASFTSNPAQSATLWLGRIAQPNARLQLTGPSYNSGNTGQLDSTAWGGFTWLANPGYLPHRSADDIGTYHLITRIKTANASPTAVWLQTDITYYQEAAGASSIPFFPTGNALGRFNGAQVFPLSGQNVWTASDIGQIIIPVSGATALTDLTQVVDYISAWSGATSGGGSQLTANYLAMLPVDGECAIVKIASYLNFSTAVSTAWLYAYLDGTQQVTAWSQETAPVPNPAHGVASYEKGNLVGATSGNYGLTFTPASDSTLFVDPATATPTGSGVNQYELIATDNNGVILPVATELAYSPLYLFPR